MPFLFIYSNFSFSHPQTGNISQVILSVFIVCGAVNMASSGGTCVACLCTTVPNRVWVRPGRKSPWKTMSLPRLVPCCFAGDGTGKQIDRRNIANLVNISQPEEEVTVR